MGNAGLNIASETCTTTSNFTLGLDVGGPGRWSRLIWGGLILLSSALAIFQGSQGSNQILTFYGLAILYFMGITAAYIAVYWILGERVLAKSNPWVNTVILVGPASW